MEIRDLTSHRMTVRIQCQALALLTLLALAPATAGAQVPSIAYLRTDCTGVSDCFTSTAALTTWLWGGGRSPAPTSGDRVTVHVGPGDFDPFVCPSGGGHVTVLGSGRDSTRFERLVDTAGLFSGGIAGAIHSEGCEELEFGNLEARGQNGVTWENGGSATWWNVDLVGVLTPAMTMYTGLVAGWYDVGPAVSEHFMFGTQIEARGSHNGSSGINVGFLASASDSWFYGGDIHATQDYDVSNIFGNWAVGMTSLGILRVFGSSVRSDVGAAADGLFVGVGDGRPGLAAVVLNLTGKFHMHGGIIRADASAAADAFDLSAITAIDSSFVHTPGTAYVVLENPAGGTATRVEALGSAQVQSPFLWPAGDTPPTPDEDHGQGMFVDTAAGSGNDESHLMVRDATCAGAGGPWRDMATGSCR
jgi:hypothetical protein